MAGIDDAAAVADLLSFKIMKFASKKAAVKETNNKTARNFARRLNFMNFELTLRSKMRLSAMENQTFL